MREVTGFDTTREQEVNMTDMLLGQCVIAQRRILKPMGLVCNK